MLRLLGIILVGGLLWGQFFPYENVFGQGDVKGFAKKAEKTYRSALKGWCAGASWDWPFAHHYRDVHRALSDAQ